KSVRSEGGKATFDVAVLEGDLGNADGPAAVFIDTVWFSLGSDGFNYIGRSQTTIGSGDPAIGSREDTSTYSGWANPPPSRATGTGREGGPGGFPRGAPAQHLGLRAPAARRLPAKPPGGKPAAAALLLRPAMRILFVVAALLFAVPAMAQTPKVIGTPQQPQI